MDGKKSWYIPDGWIPRQKAGEESGYEGHEALIVLNCNCLLYTSPSPRDEQ